MKDPTEVEYRETSNFVTRENNNKRKMSREKKGKEKAHHHRKSRIRA